MTNEALMGNSTIFDPDIGQFVSEKLKRVAEVIADYDPYLRLMYIPKNDRNESTKKFSFALGHFPPGKEPYIVRLLQESEIDERLLTSIWMNDSRRNDTLTYLDKLEEAGRALKLREDLDKREIAKDRVRSMIKSPFHKYRLSKDKVLDL